MGSSDASLVARVKEARQQISRTRERLENRKTEQVLLLRDARSKKRDVERALAAQRQYLAGIDENLQRLITQERQRQELLGRERAAAAAVSTTSGSTPAATRSSMRLRPA